MNLQQATLAKTVGIINDMNITFINFDGYDINNEYGGRGYTHDTDTNLVYQTLFHIFEQEEVQSNKSDREITLEEGILEEEHSIEFFECHSDGSGIDITCSLGGSQPEDELLTKRFLL